MKTLSPSQHQVVNHDTDPALVIAGPGAGKTHAITHRVAQLIQNGVLPHDIILTTFTKRAAHEMFTRVDEILNEIEPPKLSGGTFHSFAASILFKQFHRLGYTACPSVMSQGDAIDLIREFRPDYVEVLPKGAKLPQAKKCLNLFSQSTNKQLPLAESIEPDDDGVLKYLDVLEFMQEQYAFTKRERNLFDYDDILTEFRRLLKDFPDLRKFYGEQYRYIIIDEYQDTNIIQADIAYYLAEQHQNIMVVGDDCQSIYAFRGANIQNILSFTERFPDAAVYQLTENFRSTAPIVAVANALIEKAEEKIEKTLVAVNQDDSVTPHLFRFKNQQAQAEYVANQIFEFRNKGVDFRRMAVLYRNGYHANYLDMFLNAYSIPYVRIGGVKLTESSHIRDVLSFLRVIVNPLDAVSFRRAMKLLPGVGDKTAKRISDDLAEIIGPGVNIGEFLAYLPGSQKHKEPLRELGRLFLQLQPDTEPRKAFKLIWAYYKPIFETKYDTVDQEYRKIGIDYFFEFSQGLDTIQEVLAEFALSEELEIPNVDPSDKLTLTTIHSAKGCEWDIVFIIEAIEDALPSYRAESIEEELRLLYVAVTRAKQQLIITAPRSIQEKNEKKRAKVSRFLKGVPYMGRRHSIT